MGSRAIEAAKAFVRVVADTAPLRRGLAAVGGLVKGTASLVARVSSTALLATGVGALIAGFTAATSAVLRFAASGAGIDDIAKRTGASAESLSQLKYAAEQSGASVEDVEKGGRKLGQVLADAAGGSKSAAKSLQAVGLSAEQLAGLSFEDKMKAVAEGLSRIDDDGARSAAAMDLLGKSGANLLPMFEDGAAGISAMMAEADALGMTITGDQAKAAADFDDAWAKTKSTLSGLASTIGATVLPMVTTFLNGVATGIPIVMQVASAIGTYLWNAIVNASSALQPFIAVFRDVFGEITGFVGSLVRLLTNGEIEAAATMAWAGLKAAFLVGIAAVNREWQRWKHGFLAVFDEAMTAVMKKWHQVQNWLSKKVVTVMAAFDSSLDVDAVEAELDDMLKRQLQQTDASAAENSAERDRQFETDITAANDQLEQARAAWRTAADAAAMKAEETANEPAASTIAEDKFSELIRDMQAGDIATRVESAVKSSSPAQDLRTSAGASVLTSVINSQGLIGKQQLNMLQQIRELQRRQVKLMEDTSLVVI